MDMSVACGRFAAFMTRFALIQFMLPLAIELNSRARDNSNHIVLFMFERIAFQCNA